MARIVSRIAFASLVALLACKTGTTERKVLPSYQFLEIREVADGCGAGNALFEVENPNVFGVNIQVCRDRSNPEGGYERSFSSHHIPADRIPVKLGCRLEQPWENHFTLHWQYEDTSEPPADITDAKQPLVFRKTQADKGQYHWFIVNAHNFKPLAVTYTHNGVKDSERVEGRGNLPMLGPSKNAPIINAARYDKPYKTKCLTSGDVYP